MAEGVETRHPDYSDRIDEWLLMRRSFRGQSAIKKEQVIYLPMPSGFTAQNDGGSEMYSAYLTRAVFPEIVKPTIRGMVGIIHRLPAEIKLPPALQPMLERATADGLPLDVFHRKITEEILKEGRYSVLADVPEGGADMPFLAGYVAETLINWDEDRRDFFVLDESKLKREGFAWNTYKQFRVLQVEGGRYSQSLHENGVQRAIEIQARAAKPVPEVPLVVIGATELAIKPEDPPLLGVARAAGSIYRLDADMRHMLFNSAQDTFVVTGLGANDKLPTVTGSGVVIGLPPQADAKYVGISVTGASVMRQQMVDDRDNATAHGAKMFEKTEGGGPESGEALKIKQAAQTATLVTIAQASAQGLEKALRHAATFVGADPNSVVVKPNLKLVEATLTAQDAKALVELWQAKGISRTTLFYNLHRGDLMPPGRTQEQEDAEIEADDLLEPPEVEGDEPPIDDDEGAAADA
jgi:hypothetical protein